MAVIKVQSKAEAIEWTKRFLTVAGHGESEIRQLHEIGASIANAVRLCSGRGIDRRPQRHRRGLAH
jgi:hypothetical protein